MAVQFADKHVDTYSAANPIGILHGLTPESRNCMVTINQDPGSGLCEITDLPSVVGQEPAPPKALPNSGHGILADLGSLPWPPWFFLGLGRWGVGCSMASSSLFSFICSGSIGIFLLNFIDFLPYYDTTASGLQLLVFPRGPEKVIFKTV